ncbi:MAG: AbrB/MazE/SpoVT family DNA-binding domain-containing protein [Clostridia bacterium]|jgi:AbrB family looped-hinge helix DNA binding protein|nr:AbrB/MazE/SpoVT family DNA-binding domain-containing protein [Clostridia bacterium]MDH7573850.1 AbrB/MazE/SpoVT family DNA-binding domain-containing protein [Clostridia bacterium]
MTDAIITTVKLGSRCQMVLPAKIRKALSLSEGDEVLVTVSGNAVVVVPKPKSYADRLMGLHRDVWAGVDPDSYVRGERDSWER